MILPKAISIVVVSLTCWGSSSLPRVVEAFAIAVGNKNVTPRPFGDRALTVASSGLSTTISTTSTILQAAGDPADATNSAVETNVLSLSLPKPLGMILEENEEGAPNGVFVKEFQDSGSALAYSSKLQGATLMKVQGNDVTRETFDNIMDSILNAPATVDLEFSVQQEAGGDDEVDAEDDSPPTSEPVSFSLGTAVTIQIDGQNIQAKVGDNLRQILLDNNVEVYQGLKQKLGNCGGGGQCTFCAMDFVESEGWAERSDYEDQKLKKFPNARLACLNNIQGPATITKTQR